LFPAGNRTWRFPYRLRVFSGGIHRKGPALPPSAHALEKPAQVNLSHPQIVRAFAASFSQRLARLTVMGHRRELVFSCVICVMLVAKAYKRLSQVQL
jgi:hypothetical protein